MSDAPKTLLKIDLELCIRSGECYYNHPDLMKMSQDGSPTLLAEDPAVCDLLARALAEHAGSGAPRRRVA